MIINFEMTTISTSNIDLNKYILYINDNINELKIDFRREILQMIIYSSIEDEKIVEKGSGTQLKFADIEYNLLVSIYNFIYNKLTISTDPLI
jgi:hypothetical protein